MSFIIGYDANCFIEKMRQEKPNLTIKKGRPNGRAAIHIIDGSKSYTILNEKQWVNHPLNK